jgi:cation transport ATPase
MENVAATVLDGRLVEGRLQGDESLVTGESDVVRKSVGDEALSGSCCATGSGLYVMVTAIVKVAARGETIAQASGA